MSALVPQVAPRFVTLPVAILAGSATIVALTLAYPAGLIASLVPVLIVIGWSVRAHAPYTALGGFLVGLGLGLGGGGFVGVGRCTALTGLGGLCGGPDIPVVAIMTFVPMAIGISCVFVGYRVNR